jgi:hypothetical protein
MAPTVASAAEILTEKAESSRAMGIIPSTIPNAKKPRSMSAPKRPHAVKRMLRHGIEAIDSVKDSTIRPAAHAPIIQWLFRNKPSMLPGSAEGVEPLFPLLFPQFEQKAPDPSGFLKPQCEQNICTSLTLFSLNYNMLGNNLQANLQLKI